MILPISMVCWADATGITPQNSRSLPLALRFADICDSCDRVIGIAAGARKLDGIDGDGAGPIINGVGRLRRVPGWRHRGDGSTHCPSILRAGRAKFNWANWPMEGTSSIFGLSGHPAAMPNHQRPPKAREALRGALIALLSEQPYETISVQDIVTRAGVSRSSFYVHFRDKDDLLISGFEEIGVNSYDDLFAPSTSNTYYPDLAGVLFRGSRGAEDVSGATV